MKYVFYFLLAFMCTHGFQSLGEGTTSKYLAKHQTEVKLDSTTIQQINSEIPVDITVLPSDGDPTPSDIIKYLLDLLGGILTTCILAWLHKKFPNIFKSKNAKDYISRR